MPPTSQSDPQKILAEQLERRRHARGLLLLALAAIVFAIVRANAHTVFTRGWWRFW